MAWLVLKGIFRDDQKKSRQWRGSQEVDFALEDTVPRG